MPDTSTKKDIARKASDNALTIGLVLAGLVAVLVLIGSSVFDAGQKGDVTATQPARTRPMVKALSEAFLAMSFFVDV